MFRGDSWGKSCSLCPQYCSYVSISPCKNPPNDQIWLEYPHQKQTARENITFFYWESSDRGKEIKWRNCICVFFFLAFRKYIPSSSLCRSWQYAYWSKIVKKIGQCVRYQEWVYEWFQGIKRIEQVSLYGHDNLLGGKIEQMVQLAFLCFSDTLVWTYEHESPRQTLRPLG